MSNPFSKIKELKTFLTPRTCLSSKYHDKSPCKRQINVPPLGWGGII